VGAMDCCARGFKAAAKMHEDKLLSDNLDQRYAGWQAGNAPQMLAGGMSLDAIAADVESRGIDPQPESGRQEILENIVNRYV